MELLNNESVREDYEVLLNGIFPQQLPPILENLISKESIDLLVSKDLTDIFVFDDNTGLIKRLDKSIESPEYIYGKNWATESIKFFTFKEKGELRPLAIPNLKLGLMFTINSVLIANTVLRDIYIKDERVGGKTSHSESPIIGREGLFSSILYEDEEILPEEDIPVGFIGYGDTNKFFEENRLQRYSIEDTYPYIFHVDLSNFFENIYTHKLGKISVTELGINDDDGKLKQYLEWLDEYNQKVNDNHTKGIIQGPISSKITAELLQLSIDQRIVKLIENLNLEINFTRYVDDYRFYARRESDVEVFKHQLMKLLREYQLPINNSKEKVYKGFEISKQAQLEKYPQFKKIFTSKRKAFSFDRYILFRDMVIEMIDGNDITTIKAVLKIMMRNVQKMNVSFEKSPVTESLIKFLIKLSYVKPILSSRIYNLINSIGINISSQERHVIWKQLFKELEYIEEYFSDTDLEIWYFYVLSQLGTADEVSKVYTSYTRGKLFHELNVLVLTAILRSNSKKTNLRFQKKLLEFINESKDKESFLRSISQSRWWITIAKLRMVLGDDINDKLKNLFIQKNGNINYRKMGIVEVLIRNNK